MFHYERETSEFNLIWWIGLKLLSPENSRFQFVSFYRVSGFISIMDCTQFIIKVIYDSNSIKLSWYAYCIRTRIPEQNCTIEIAYCQTIWHDKWQCDICNDNKCKNTFQEKYKTRQTPGPRTVMTHNAEWHCVRVLTTFIIHYICTKLNIFAQICFGLQISILVLTSLVSAIVEGVLRIIWNIKIHHRVYKRPPFVPILRQMSPSHRFPHFFNTPTLLPSHLCISKPTHELTADLPNTHQ